MCGFVSYEQATIKEYPQWEAAITEAISLDSISSTISLGAQANSPLQYFLDNWPDYAAYPAFGGDVNKRIPLLILEDDKLKHVNAIWWFDAHCEQAFDTDKNVTVLGRRTSFNARNLNSPFWKGALNHHRGIAFANQLGESKLVGKTKHQYLMRSNEPFLLGAIYRKLPNGDYCCAIITRDAHPKMTPYHEKAFPLFLPIDNHFLKLWLSSEKADTPLIQALLDEPKLYPDLHVQRVKTYKGKQTIGNTNALLTSDLP